MKKLLMSVVLVILVAAFIFTDISLTNVKSVRATVKALPPVSSATCSVNNNSSSFCQAEFAKMLATIEKQFPSTTIPGQKLMTKAQAESTLPSVGTKGYVSTVTSETADLMSYAAFMALQKSSGRLLYVSSTTPVWVVQVNGSFMPIWTIADGVRPNYKSELNVIDAVNGQSIGFCQGCTVFK